MPTVGMVSLGCAKNRVDGELMLGRLKDKGYELVSDPAQAEVILVNLSLIHISEPTRRS